MKQKRFTVEQIVAVLKQAEAGVPLAELLRRVGVSEQTHYRCKKQYDQRPIKLYVAPIHVYVHEYRIVPADRKLYFEPESVLILTKFWSFVNDVLFLDNFG